MDAPLAANADIDSKLLRLGESKGVADLSPFLARWPHQAR